MLAHLIMLFAMNIKKAMMAKVLLMKSVRYITQSTSSGYVAWGLCKPLPDQDCSYLHISHSHALTCHPSTQLTCKLAGNVSWHEQNELSQCLHTHKQCINLTLPYCTFMLSCNTPVALYASVTAVCMMILSSRRQPTLRTHRQKTHVSPLVLALPTAILW